MRETLVKTDDFKDSPVGRIPKDWKIGKLSDVAINHDGKRIPLKQSDRDKMEGIYPYYGASGVIDWVDSYLFEGDYVLLGEDGENVVSRQLPLAFRASGKFWVNNHAHIYEPLPNVDIRFLTILLEYTDYSPLISGSAQPKLTQEALNRLDLRIPPLEEQKSIADILDTVNEAIAHTSSLIAKLKQMKAGLLHDLLTQGLDENGELRDAIAHPEQFKDSLLGQIPKNWEVFKLSEIVPHAEYGISVSLDDEDGIPVLRMNNLKDGEVDLTDLKKSASSKAANLLLQPLDVLFNRTNSIEHVGRTAIWRGQIERASFASYLVRLLPDQSKLIPEYLNVWLNLPTTQLLIRRYATPGVHQVNINPTNLRKVLIALPQKTSEQQTIVERIAAHDTRIRAEEAYRDKLKLQKQGLMHDLLTGKVRVNGVDKSTSVGDTVHLAI